MRRLTPVVILLFITSAVAAAEVPASEDSIREVLRVTEARKLVEGMFSQVDAMMSASMKQALQGHRVTEEQQKIIDRMSAKMMAMMKEELSWDKLEPLYLDIYKKSFTQEEMDGMITFYKSTAGAALIKKMPVVMQQTMSAMQERMGPMMKKMQGAMRETIEELGNAKQN